MLSGKEILKQIKKGNIVIQPFDIKRLNTNSYNVTLSPVLKVYDCDVIDMKKDNPVKEIIMDEKEGYVLQPGVLYIASIMEYTETRNFVPCIDGRSSVGRLGIEIHRTAGFGDVGFCGKWTLEMTCTQPTRIYPYVEIGQLYYEKVQGKQTQYKGRYMGQKEPVTSRFFQDYETPENTTKPETETPQE